MQIISVSRRTDVPAFYMEWFMQRVKAGVAFAKNPFRNELRTVSLNTADVAALVFWSKNFAPALPDLLKLRAAGYELFFHYTVTGHAAYYEPYVPPWTASIAAFQTLAKHFPGRVGWRFDPILLTEEADWVKHEAGAELL